MKIEINLYKSKDNNYYMVEIGAITDQNIILRNTSAIPIDVLKLTKDAEYLIEYEMSKLIHSFIKEVTQQYDVKPEHFFSENKEQNGTDNQLQQS